MVRAVALASVFGIVVVFSALVKKFSSKPEPDPEPDPESQRGASELSHHGNSLLTSGYKYEVFLSFRGSDTRQGFTDFLYHALVDAGLRTFRDDESLRTGEEIGGNLLKAISESRISIPIFSKNYASSMWCLKELTCMLEQKKKGKHKILPVFYDVTPSEVQDQTGEYGKALHKHEKKNTNKCSVQLWREALAEVGRLKGMDLLKLANGYQGQLTKLVVSKVLRELNKAQLIVTENLVGTDYHVEAVKQLLQLGEPDVRIVCIWGMGGIGKTTLSKVIYNQILDEFEGYSFIGDIRETSRCKGIEYLQSSLIADLSRCERPDFRNVDEGIDELNDRYRGNKVLILLDDIDDANHLKALVIRHDSFGPGSRIILTTRNRDVLHRHFVDCVYEVEAMNEDNALKLFSKHAFRKDSPLDELVGLSRDIVKTTGGLPLALEVIGSLLYGKCKIIWKGTLEKLKTIPNEEVQDKLQVSFEALDHEQKQIFLDIACFFIGEHISLAFPMWEDCKFFPEIGVDVLVAKSLIKIGGNNEIWMHDQLRDLGREIVRRENRKKPGKRSRLWESEEAKYVLANQKGSSKVEAICVYYPYDRFTSEQFRNLTELRFLNISWGVRFTGDFKNLIQNLRWLRWPFSALSSLSNLHLPNLVSLELPYNDLINDWRGFGSVQMMKLEVLDLSNSKYLTRTPSFYAFPNLERLILSCCYRLEVVDLSVSRLNKLTYLDISYNSSIKELPHELGSLEKLEFFDACWCPKLSKIPSSIIDNLYDLQTLNLRGCNSLETFSALPDTLHSQRVDRHANLITLDDLQTLNLRDCNSFETFSALPDTLHSQRVDRHANLITLDISDCGKLKSLPSLSNLKLLRTLNAYNCSKLEEIVGLDQLYALERLDITNCSSIKQLPDLSKLQKLGALYARDCYKLQELVGLDELKALKKLQIAKCKEITKLPNLSKLKHLGELCAYGCEKLQEVVGLDALSELRVANLSMCKEIKKLTSLYNLSQLEELNIFGCEKLQELVGLDELKALKSLTIAGCRGIERLPDLSNLKQLQYLDARGCEKLRGLPGLDKLGSLLDLRIDGCKEIENLSELEELDSVCFAFFHYNDEVSMEKLVKKEMRRWCYLEKEEDMLERCDAEGTKPLMLHWPPVLPTRTLEK